MRLARKLSIALLILLVLSQIPFAYRRYRLGRLNAAIQSLQRVSIPDEGSYKQFKGVLHVHSFLGGHSSGGFQEIISGAKLNGLDFVVMTEHPAKEFNTAEMTLKGTHAGVLFVNGNEIGASDGSRLLIAPGDELTGRANDFTTNSALDHAKTRNQLSVLAYPTEYQQWQTDGYDAMEVYNLYANARRINPLVAFCDSLWSYRSYHDLLFANYYTRPSEALAKWDSANRVRRVVGLAGNDAHANIGVSFNDSSGKTLLGLRLDPYAISFHLVRVHVLIPIEKSLDEPALLSALKLGHCFIGFDLFGETDGFNFTASNSSDQRIQGDEIALQNGVKLTITVPHASRILLFKNGSVVKEENVERTAEFVASEQGVYRVEVYLPQLNHRAGEQPWIISNPVYVR